MKTVDTIMQEMQDRVIANVPISPASWCESPLRINALMDEIDTLIALQEAKMVHIEAEYIKQDIPATKAKILAKDSIDYKNYLLLKAKRNKVTEYIRLAKKRAVIQDI